VLVVPSPVGGVITGAQAARPSPDRNEATRRNSHLLRQLRSSDGDEFAWRAFAGLEMIPSGVVFVSEWRPNSDGPRPTAAEVRVYMGGVHALTSSGRQALSGTLGLVC
jgi:hypothetical protein